MRSTMPRVTTTALCAAAFALSGAAAASAAFEDKGILGTGAGSGAGQLDAPVGVDVGPDGSVYVVDSGNERIVKFGPSGAFERAWGKDVDSGGGTGFEVCTTVCKAGVDGSLAGETESVEDVAVAPDGLAVYVTDDGNRRVSQYAPDGTFVRAWGRDVTPGGGTEFEICTASCKAGIDGEEGGHLRRPDAIAVGPSGDVYVTETINGRVSQFTSTGDFIRAFGVDVDTGGGTGYETCTADCKAGDGDADGIGVTAAGEVYLADSGEDYVARFSSVGAFLGSFGGDGSGAATIVNPQSVDIGADGQILITQTADANAIFRFSAGPDVPRVLRHRAGVHGRPGGRGARARQHRLRLAARPRPCGPLRAQCRAGHAAGRRPARRACSGPDRRAREAGAAGDAPEGRGGHRSAVVEAVRQPA